MEKNRFIHYGFVLTLIAAVSAAILSIVNGVTTKIIKENEIAAVNAARILVLPRAVSFDEGDTIKFDELEFIPGKGEKGNIVGYVVSVSQPGYAGNIDFVLGLDRRGRVTGLNIIGSQETPGLGSKILDLDWQKKAIGKDLSYEFNKSVDGFSGATISPNAVYTGIKRALTSFKNGVNK